MDAVVVTSNGASSGNDDSPPSGSGEIDERRIARKLTEALDRAMELGLFEHANRIAADATRIARHRPSLADRLARLRFSQGDPETALRLIDACAWRSASLRLLRAACLISLGRTIEAQLDLREWSLKSSAPLQARLMLALLEWRDGQHDAAISTLVRNLKHIEDPRTVLALALIAAHNGRRDAARLWADVFQKNSAAILALPNSSLILQSIGLARRAESNTEIPAADVELLATELQASEEALDALVESLRLRFDESSARLLAAAIEKAMPGLSDQFSAGQSLEQLNAIIDRHWGADHHQSATQERPDVLATIGDDHSDNAAGRRERAA